MAVWLLAGISIVGIFIIAQAVSSIMLRTTQSGNPGQQGHPEANPVGGYTISVSQDGHPFEPVQIGADGTGCDRVRPDEALRETCVVAVNLLPSVIGGAAQGKLNLEHTPAFDALVWRARANDDKEVCNEGGLLGTFLEECRAAETATGYRSGTGAIRVQVPLGGAIKPNPSLSASPQ